MLRPLVAGHARRAQQVLAHPASRQLIRYAVAGLLVTWFAGVIYSTLVVNHLNPFLANIASTGCGLIAGYTVHSRWSFRDGRKDHEALQLGRFLTATAGAFAINNFWIWLVVKQLGFSPLAPVPLMLAATPLLSFFLNRYWVFKAA